jgi:hypothetical protein
MYGKAAAIYLYEKLKTVGYESPYFCCEDWGWWVGISGQGFSAGLGIYGQLNETTKELSISVTVNSPQPGKRWSWRRFRQIDYTPIAQKIHADVLKIFQSDPEVQILAVNDDPYLD